MKHVYSATTVAQAEMVRVVLRRERIPSMVSGDSIGLRGPATPIVVSVADRHAARAVRVVRDMFARKKPRTAKRRTGKTRKKAAARKKAKTSRNKRSRKR